ncbi:MAG: phospholipase [Paludibacteraceae bacterium]|nr:phospholipase [Paludibacteraceae bacterium]
MSIKATIIALIVFIMLGIVTWYLRYLQARKSKKTKVSDSAGGESKPRPEGCCGQHEVCEKESLLATQIKAEYFDDEELDAFIGREGDYTDEETEQFAEVLYTLREEEVAQWLNSLQVRGIRLPENLRDEALMIVSERRGS